MSIARISDIECYYEIHGRGKPLLLIGGLASDSQTWSLMLPLLKEHFEVIVFDNRGVGRTKDPGGDIDVSTLAKDAIGLMDHLEVGSACIVGHSMGGYIAREIAGEFPKRVEGLILASTAASTSQRNKSLCRELSCLYSSPDRYEAFLREFMNWLFTPGYLHAGAKFDKLLKYLLDYPYRQSPDDFKRQVKAYVNYSPSDKVDNNSSKTLVMAGDMDKLISRGETETLASEVSGCKVLYLDGTAHSLPAESPNEFARTVLEFCG